MSTKTSLITKDYHLFSTLFFPDSSFFHILHMQSTVLDTFQLLLLSYFKYFLLVFLIPISSWFSVLLMYLVSFSCCVNIGDLSFSHTMSSPQAVFNSFIVSNIATSRAIFPSWSLSLGGLTPASHIFYELHYATSATHSYGHSLKLKISWKHFTIRMISMFWPKLPFSPVSSRTVFSPQFFLKPH